jgi:regulator of protease activity HflC (stomatin/prohibitin superfamily)
MMAQGAPSFSEMRDDDVLQNEIRTSLCAPNFLSTCLFAVAPWTVCGGVKIVRVKQEHVLLNMGKHMATLREPGCYFVNPCCLEDRLVSTAMIATDLHNVKVADGRGNPLLLSGVVTYRVVNAKKAVLDVQNYSTFLNTQGTTVMKKVASMYPYEARGEEPSLKSEAGNLRHDLMRLLQQRVDVAGLEVVNFELNDLAYAPEIAQQMLVRQQAEAIVDSRKVIAEGAVQIVTETLRRMGELGLDMDSKERSRMASNMVVAICAESGVNPVMNIGASSV